MSVAIVDNGSLVGKRIGGVPKMGFPLPDVFFIIVIGFKVKIVLHLHD
jgi:hypothetical protein